MTKEELQNVIFLDFETNGLYGPCLELYALDYSGKELINCVQNDLYLNQMLLSLLKIGDDGKQVFWVWSRWHVDYIQKHAEEFFKESHANVFCFADVCMFLFGKRKIEDITKLLVRREHKGNAIQDAKDLLDAFCQVARSKI